MGIRFGSIRPHVALRKMLPGVNTICLFAIWQVCSKTSGSTAAYLVDINGQARLMLYWQAGPRIVSG